MNLREFRQMAERWWAANRINCPIIGAARVVTGNPNNDALFHYMLVDNGVEMILEQERRPMGGVQWRLKDFKVIDERKFVMFSLKWSQ